MRGKVYILVYCPIDTLQWGSTHSALVASCLKSLHLTIVTEAASYPIKSSMPPGAAPSALSRAIQLNLLPNLCPHVCQPNPVRPSNYQHEHDCFHF